MKNSKILNFKISKQKDFFAFFEYLKQPENESLLLKFTGLEKSQISIDNINDFIDDFYFKKSSLIEKSIEETSVAWADKEEFFLKEVKNIFNIDHIEKTTVIPSIWPIFGRFFEGRFITFPCDKPMEDRLFVLVHELLHFIFYDYIYSKFHFSEEQMSNQAVWDFSEVINVLIQNQEKWIENFTLKAKPYPVHSELHKNMKAEWDKNKNIDYLINGFLLENL